MCRISHYYACDNEIEPHENCFSKLTRIMFLHKPNPYHYDYRLVKLSYNNFEQATFLLRQQFGYSNRMSSTRKRTIKSDTSYSFTKKSSKSEQSVYNILRKNSYFSCNDMKVK